MSKCRKYKNMKKRRYARIKRLMITFFVMVIGVCTILFGSAFVSPDTAGSGDISRKHYKSIVVNAGDSMWSIADTYLTEEYSSKKEYIKEVMEVNQMESTTLYADQKLIVPYYEHDYVASVQ